MRIQEKIRPQEIAVVSVLLFAASAIFTWPLAALMARAVPLASEPAAVAYFQLFSWRWTALSLPQGWQAYWNPGFFHPLPGVFAWCEPQLLNCLLAMLFDALPGCAGVCGYNLMLFFNMVLLGMAGYVLARRLTDDRIATFLCGLWLCCGAFSLNQLCAPAVLAAGWPLLVIFALVSYAQQPRFAYAVLAAAAYTAVWFTHKQYAVFLLAIAPLMLLAWWQGGRQALKALVLFCAGLAAVSVIVLPYVLAQYRLAAEAGFSRGAQVVWAVSDWRQLLMPGTGHWLRGRGVPVGVYSWSLGAVMLLLIGAAMALGWLRSLRSDERSGRLALGLTIMALVSLAIAAGGRIIASALMRTPERFAFFAIAGLAVLAASAFARLRSMFSSAGARRLFTTAVFVLLAAEMWTMPLRLVDPAQEIACRQAAIGYLRGHDPHIPVLELPLRQGSAAIEAAAMLAMLEHRHPLINGYASFSPARYRAFKNAWIDDPAGQGIRQLAGYQPVYVLAHLSRCLPAERMALRSAAGQGTVIIDDGSIMLLRLPSEAGKKSD